MKYYKSLLAGASAALIAALLYVAISLAFSFEYTSAASTGGHGVGTGSVGITLGPAFLLLVGLAFVSGFLWKLARTSAP
jgi:hypothetical protein